MPVNLNAQIRRCQALPLLVHAEQPPHADRLRHNHIYRAHTFMSNLPSCTPAPSTFVTRHLLHRPTLSQQRPVFLRIHLRQKANIAMQNRCSRPSPSLEGPPEKFQLEFYIKRSRIVGPAPELIVTLKISAC